MQLVTLPHTELSVSRACLGSMTFGGQIHETASLRILDRAIDAGINFIDTANNYNRGLSEEILGKALAGRRHRFILATKVFNKTGDEPDQAGLSRKAILRAVDESLSRLRTDYLDLYYLHAPDWKTPLEETLDTMQDLVQLGKIRYPAASNYAAWQIARMHAIADRNGYQPIRVTQPMYSLLARGIEQEYLAMAEAHQVSLVVYNPLAGGLLTGKHSRRAITPGTRFDNNKMYQDRYWQDDMFDAVDALSRLLDIEKRSLISISLNWLYHHTPTNCIILGATSPDQLSANLAALEEGPLSENALRTCDVIWSALKGPAPKYNR